MTHAERTPMAKFFDALAYEKDAVKITHRMDKKGDQESIHVKLSCGFAKFTKNGQHFEFSFISQIQLIDQACFESIIEKLVIKG
ncbi:TPA: hypothetical protein ACGHB6_002635 [Acinetobacter baumannii]|uniref:hypothetical protein n=1 Tax=Acinetobacter baumannii TaxID=470 RepID=UPI000A3CD734|nr:hypothetical protein [Acinetobacter baumannii]EHU1307691.1 hypothetical protein [Acinetobacter baumannii]EHU2441345.1 hypothetical protein [Acinetobacter baumannii]EJB5621378.1 hypothetical protein [Acinetobacter baumannii]ELB0340660.1 hypothetical protein [Acinetobacter baumannii]ELN4153671.1 hypothetical protein [Acinetobacter baumannii]